MSTPAAPAAVDASRLPASSSPDLIIVPVTAAECEQTWCLNADEWKGPLSLSEYFERERYLLARDLTQHGGITAWMLTSKTLGVNPDGTRPILAACETILKSAYIARNGKLEKVRVHGIGSVYTRAEHRGKGYAGRMMRELAKTLETYQQHNGDKESFSLLWSDIGQQFYAKHGWQAFMSTHIDLATLDTDEYRRISSRLPSVQDITREDLIRIPTTSYMEEALQTISNQHPNVPCVAVNPDMLHFDWHHAREEISSKILKLPFPQIKGALHEGTGIAIIWTRIFASNRQEWKLQVLHVVLPPTLRFNPTNEAREALSALLLRAQHEAYTWNMAAGVQVWDPSEFIVSAAQRLRTEEQGKVELVSRNTDHICSLRWTGARRGDDLSKNVVWVNVEKYAWC